MYRRSCSAALVIVVVTAICATGIALAEPVVREVREGGASVIRINSIGDAEKTYRIDLSQRHSPASQENDLLKRPQSAPHGRRQDLLSPL